jgi:hypothetical protein
MPIPVPPVPLENICSVIFNSTLYTYSAGAFQSLQLSEGATWKSLPGGEPVTGGVCVGSTPKDSSQAGLYIVGGKGTTAGYHGLQKYTYATGKWESIKLKDPVTQERLWHGASYINSTNHIVIYAGNQDGVKQPSSATFTIQASAPYEVLAYESIASPAVEPILMPWSETQVAMVGGSVENKRVMLFNPATYWVDSGATMADPIPKSVSQIKATLLNGDDGCKNLYTFDMTTSPNQVNRIVLLNSSGQPVQNSPTIKTRSVDTGAQSEALERGAEKRALTLNEWPVYNATLAPVATRSNAAVAENSNGLVVFSGGNIDDVLCMFNARENKWQNASAVFTAQKVAIASLPSPSSTSDISDSARTSPSPTTSTSSPPTVAAATSQSDTGGAYSNTVLGIVLGSIFGLLLLLGLVLFCIRRRKAHQNHIEAGHARRASGVTSSEKSGFGFASDSLPAQSGGHFRGHQAQDSQASFSSVAILMGRVNQQKPGLSRKMSNDSRRSSTSSIFNKQFKSTISKPMPHLTGHPALQPQQQPRQPREEKAGASLTVNTNTTSAPRPRGSGVDRAGSTRRSSGWNRYWSGGSALNILGFGASKRTTVDSDQSSHYSDMNRMTQDSATVPHLHVEGRPELNRVNSGSPTVSQYNSKIPLREGLTGRIERPLSQASSGYSSGIPASVHEAWDPTGTKTQPWGAQRAPSSAYTASYSPNPTGASQAIPQSGVSQQPQLMMATTSSDMSWLNLGDQSRDGKSRA